MEKRIELEKRGREPSQITELNLDNCRSTNIVGLTDEYTALETLSLINVGLTSLKGFPKLPNLKKLELSDNRIANGLNNLSGSLKLTNLNLSGNKIKDLEELNALADFKTLTVLDLFNNELTTSTENYREKIFSLIPSLVYLDGYDAQDVECVSEGDDEDELNGNDSDEDAVDGEDISKPFFVNGMEIDLGELEQFEKRLAEKRRLKQLQPQQQLAESATTSQPTASTSADANGSIDDLDAYLDRLAIDIKAREHATAAKHTEPDCDNDNNSSKKMAKTECHTALATASSSGGSGDDAALTPQASAKTSLPLLLFSLFSVIIFIQSVISNHGSDVDGGNEEGDEDGLEYDEEVEDEESEDGENGDVGLAAVYDEHGDDDENSDDYVEEEVGDEEDDIDSDEDVTAEEVRAEDGSPRGTKRKHEEDDNDG